MEKKKEVVIVPHTHWDREWYKPFQEFRHQLVHLIDSLIEIFDTQPDYYFMLDGQTIILEDYFEVRPEKKNRILELVREGRIDVGPWYMLPDEWLVSGESLIRNLEYSHEFAEKHQIALMSIAYLPDMFGHSKAIPRILLDLTNLQIAVVWRGVGDEIESDLFLWKSDEESKGSLLTIYLPGGYGNAAEMSLDKEHLISEIRGNIENLDSYVSTPVYLLMNGTDHRFPQHQIQQLLKEIEFRNYEISIGSISDFIQKVKNSQNYDPHSLTLYTGEFRSSKHAPLLQDTYSTRMWIKQYSQLVNDLLIHYAEPLHTILFLLGKEYPKGTFQTAWKWYLRNQPHDSICGCSADQVHDEMRVRFDWSAQIANNLINDFQSYITEKVVTNQNDKVILVYNPTNSLQLALCKVYGFENINVHSVQDSQGRIYPAQVLENGELIFFASLKPWSFTQLNFSFKNEEYDSLWNVSEDEVSNQFFQINFHDDGTFTLYDKLTKLSYQKIHQFEDWGDRGDSYTFGRLGPRITKTVLKKRQIISVNKLFSEIAQYLFIILPEQLSDDRQARIGGKEIPLLVKIRVYREIPRIDFETQLNNTVKDHRLRITVPLPFTTNTTITSTHFGVVKRFSKDLDDDTCIEKPSGIQAQRRFIRVEDENKSAGFTLINQGLPEVELVEDNILALTLIRAIGQLSRDDFEERPLHAGPDLPLPKAQEQQPYTFRYSFLPHSSSELITWSADQAEMGNLTPQNFLVSKKKAALISNKAIITLSSPEIRISSIRIKNQSPLITLYNLTGNIVECKGTINEIYSKLQKVTVKGEIKDTIDSKDHNFKLAMNPYEIILLKLIP
jgi:alpha-mannosidase